MIIYVLFGKKPETKKFEIFLYALILYDVIIRTKYPFETKALSGQIIFMESVPKQTKHINVLYKIFPSFITYANSFLTKYTKIFKNKRHEIKSSTVTLKNDVYVNFFGIWR